MQTRSWEDRDGNKRWTTEIVASGMQMLGSPRGTPSETELPPADVDAPDLPEPDDDIPF